jgi:hypothetical protein
VSGACSRLVDIGDVLFHQSVKRHFICFWWLLIYHGSGLERITRETIGTIVEAFREHIHVRDWINGLLRQSRKLRRRLMDFLG